MRRGGSRCERDVFCTEDGLARAVRNLSHSGARAVAVAAEAPNVRPRCAMFREVGAMEPSRGRRVTRGRVGRDAAPPQLPQVGRRPALAARSSGVTSGNGQAGVAKLGPHLRQRCPIAHQLDRVGMPEPMEVDPPPEPRLAGRSIPMWWQ